MERLIHQVVFPEEPDIDVAPLYWDVDRESLNPTDLLDRHRARVPAGSRASTATYFNAFPAGYWKRWTSVADVVLTVRVAGKGGMLSVYRSTPDGREQRLHTLDIAAGPAQEHIVALSLMSFGDGGWLWFDLVAGHEDVTLESATYTADGPSTATATCSVSITTFNRPDWCLRLLRQLSVAVEEIPEIDRVQVVDQGTARVMAEPGFDDVRDRLGAVLRIVEQPNLGGAGGFARGMVDTVDEGRSNYVLLLDDDVEIERESIRRALVFADLCRVPTIVGGQMLSADSRSSLYSFGEVVDMDRFWWHSATDVDQDHDFAERALRSTPWMHRRVDVDFNGWWMCLIPVEVINNVGLPLPVFIKWDDAEYGLRAREAGYPTVSPPGVALWHIPWTEKDDSVGWQAYFHLRNRLVAALLHSPRDRGGLVLADVLAHQVKHIASMQYSPATLRMMALQDVMRGPRHLLENPAQTLARIRSARRELDDTVVQTGLDGFPEPVTPTAGAGGETRPHGRADLVRRAARGLLHQLRPVAASAYERPQEALSALRAQWWTLSTMDSAVVSLRDGTGYVWYRRRPALARELLMGSLVAHARLAQRWGSLAAEYRASMPEIVSPEAWSATLAEAS